jgi:hypothetical protein
LWNAYALLLSQLHKSGAGIKRPEILLRTKRTLNQRANISTCFSGAFLLLVKQVQVLSCEVVTGNDQIRLNGGDRPTKRR